MIEKHEEDTLELRPEYIEKAKRIMKQKPIRVGTPKGLRKMMY
jgi:hypothetical protein